MPSHIDLAIIEKPKLKESTKNGYVDTDNYIYCVDKSVKGITYLYCKKNDCPARAKITAKCPTAGTLTTPHNHHSCFEERILEKFKARLQMNIVADPFAAPRALYAKTTHDLNMAALPIKIPAQIYFKNLIARTKKLTVPVKPKDFNQFKQLINDERYSAIYSLDNGNKPFYRTVQTGINGKSCIIFLSEDVRSAVVREEELSVNMDGTFKNMPNGSLKILQLFVISVMYNGRSYSLLYAFLQAKTTETYATLLRYFLTMVPSKKIKNVMADFEPALRKCIGILLPHARLTGCWFHFIQAVSKQTKKFGLRRIARADEELNRAINKIFAVPLLPEEYVSEAFRTIDTELLLDNTPENWSEFMKYLKRQWLNNDLSVYGLEDRTNNYLESFNRTVSSTIGCKNPGIWKVIHNLKAINFQKSNETIRAIDGEILKTKKNRKYVLLAKQIEAATMIFEKQKRMLHCFCNR